MSPATPLLKIRDLRIAIEKEQQSLPAIRGVDLDILPGEIVALVGESGCGKTLTAMSILRLIEPPIQITNGEITFNGENILNFNQETLNAFRGSKAAMIFQEPMTALNPVFTIGSQIIEVLVTHGDFTKTSARKRAQELLTDVGIPHPESRIDAYPFELSGGMRQRAMIAMALAGNPSLLIADEPTTALDVTIQAQILALIKKLSAKNKMSVLLITHDLGTVSQLADRAAIMYAGKIVEYGPTEDILNRGKHPYTQGLLNSLPSMAFTKSAGGKPPGKSKKSTGVAQRLQPIQGSVPSLDEIPTGCAFRTRCTYVKTGCEESIPMKTSGNRGYRCVL